MLLRVNSRCAAVGFLQHGETSADAVKAHASLQHDLVEAGNARHASADDTPSTHAVNTCRLPRCSRASGINPVSPPACSGGPRAGLQRPLTNPPGPRATSPRYSSPSPSKGCPPFNCFSCPHLFIVLRYKGPPVPQLTFLNPPPKHEGMAGRLPTGRRGAAAASRGQEGAG